MQSAFPRACGDVNFPKSRLKYYRKLKEGQNWRNLSLKLQKEALGKSFYLGGGKTGFLRRLAWNKPSPTLVTDPMMPATDLGHPVEDRPLSIQEYKRIQEFPDNWKLSGNLRNQYKPEIAMGPSGILIPENIINKPPTAELRENQTDQDSLPDYNILDDILYKLIEEEMSVVDIIKAGHDKEWVSKIQNLLFISEYKRRQAPPGVKISVKNFGKDRRYPITNNYRDTN